MERKAIIYAILTILLWSTVATAFKLTLREIDFINMLMYATFISLISFLIILIIERKVILILRQSKFDLINSAFMGLLNPFFYYLVLFKAYSLLPAQIAQPLNYTWPIILSVFSMLFLKEQLHLEHILGLLISFSGVVIISTKGKIYNFRAFNLIGVLLAIGSSFIWAIYWIKNMKDKRDFAVKLFSNFGFGLIYILVLNIYIGNCKFINFKQFLLTSYIGLFEMGITFFIWLKAISYAKIKSRISNLIYLSPFISLIFIRLILKEQIYISSFIGLVLIVSGIIVNNSAKKT